MDNTERKGSIKRGSWLDSFLSKRYSSSIFTYKEVLKMLVPLIIDQFFIYSIGMLTSAMISASSQESVVAINLVSPLTMVAMCLFSSVSAGGTVIVAQYKGKGEDSLVRQSSAHVIMFTFAVAVVFSLMLIIFAVPTVDLFFGDAEAIVKTKSYTYLAGFSWSLIPFAIYNGIFSVLRGVGETKICLRLTIIINVAYFIASFLFINVLKMDIEGTVYAYIIARALGGLAAIYALISKKSKFRMYIRDFMTLKLSMIKSMIKLGIPFAVEQVLFNVGSLVSQVYMVQLGTVAMAANSIAGSVTNLFYGTGAAVSTLAVTIVGQCIGADDIKLAKFYSRRLVEIGTVVILASVAVFYPLMPLILKLYAPEAATLSVIYQLVLIAVIPLPFFWSMSNIMPSNLRAAGDVNYTSVVSLITMWIFRIGLGYLLAITCGLGVYGIWYCIGIEWGIKSLIYYLRFRGTKWYSKKVI